MTRISTLLIYFLLIAGQLMSQSVVTPVVNDQLFPVQAVVMKGYVGGRLDASYKNRILAQDVDRLVAPFNNRTETSCWQSEFWGKWFTSAVLAYRYRPEPQLKAILDKAVDGLIATQSADGYIGNYADEKHLAAWDIWGRKYCMLGLLSYYDLTSEKKALKAAGKVADHLMNELKVRNALIVNLGNHHGMAASSVLEPICQLYTRTGNKKYLEFAEEIVRQWETPEGPQLISKSTVNVAERFPKPKVNWYGPEQGSKAYEMMSCYEGLLELYRLTGKNEYKKAVENTWQNILDTEINIAGSGSGVECWFGGKHLQTMHIGHYQETCVTATWIKLGQQLLRLTGEAKYADAIEQTWYNSLLGAMYPDGADWAKYTPLEGQRLEGGEQCGMGLNCCVASGPRGLFTLPLTAVMSEMNGICVNFFAEGNYKLQTPDQKKLEVEQQTDYPVSGNVTLKLSLPKAEQMKVRIRIPQWSKNTTLDVNGQQAEVVAGEYTELTRTWKSGDVINLSLDMRGRVVHMGDQPDNIAIVRGPIVLTRDVRLGSPHVDLTIEPVADKDGFVKLEPAGTNKDGIWMKFTCPFMLESHKEGANKPTNITLCDYSSAGNTVDDHSWFRVWLPQPLDPRKIDNHNH